MNPALAADVMLSWRERNTSAAEAARVFDFKGAAEAAPLRNRASEALAPQPINGHLRTETGHAPSLHRMRDQRLQRLHIPPIIARHIYRRLRDERRARRAWV